MRTSHRTLALLAAVSLASGAAAPAQAASDHGTGTGTGKPAHSATATAKHAFEFGVIGDVPYGQAQIDRFPEMIDELSSHSDELEFLAHVGDVKAGSAVCSDEYFQMIRGEFDRLTLPLVFTPGDNDWVDCHRANNGAYNPLERLDSVRDIFFPVADRTLGVPMKVDSQDELGLPENQRFREQRVEFVAIDVQGSHNSTDPWAGLGLTVPTPEQLAEVAHRDAANIAQVSEAFDDARRTNARGVVIFTQADMFEPRLATAGITETDVAAFRPIVGAIAEQARAFDGPVYLINGDSHRYNADEPLAAGSPWVDAYGVGAVENLQRVTVEGDATSNEWTRFTVAPNSAGKGKNAAQELLTWERVPYTF